MRLNVLILVGVFGLLAAFYSRQLPGQQKVAGIPAESPLAKGAASATPAAKSPQPAPVQTTPAKGELPRPTSAQSAPGGAPPAQETKTAATQSKPPMVETKSPTPDAKSPGVIAPPPVAEAPAPGKPPVPETKPTLPPAPAPAKVAPKSTVGPEKVAQSKGAFKQIVQALQAYFRDMKRYPTDLHELLPIYLGAIPLDPCTGQPYYYIPVNTPVTSYILTTGRYPSSNACRSVSQGFSYTTETGMQNSP